MIGAVSNPSCKREFSIDPWMPRKRRRSRWRHRLMLRGTLETRRRVSDFALRPQADTKWPRWQQALNAGFPTACARGVGRRARSARDYRKQRAQEHRANAFHDRPKRAASDTHMRQCRAWRSCRQRCPAPVAYGRVFVRTATRRLLIPRPRTPRATRIPVDGSGTTAESLTNSHPSAAWGGVRLA